MGVSKIAKGKWIIFDAGETIDISAEDIDGFTLVAEIPHSLKTKHQYLHDGKMAVAELITEAGNVANETGKSPRELVELLKRVSVAFENYVGHHEGGAFELNNKGGFIKLDDVIDDINQTIQTPTP